ncbi:hypothetical protein Riv7116_6092 [Rivularia sp. PCC 7116]|uniref:hypothetical protein n=1 Tax=Rivularia sp. PCC 7116 TaxID=373994 RepID=UPI00029F056D|nr:hypothetical protein [Rivularia sp. PCC 7116]AFY58448.1 hypothetical protein Riv7116_6092 [Rivularia sp. PCC 7116]
MIPRLQRILAKSKSAVVLSLISLSAIYLVSCSDNASENNVTQETNLSADTSTEADLSQDLSTQTNISTEKSVTAVKQTKKITPSQLIQIKQALPGKNVIIDHAFQVNLKEFGTTLFVPAKESSEDSPQPKLGLYLVKDGQIKFTFPLPEDVQPWNFLELDAVSFEQNSQNKVFYGTDYY